MYCMYVYLSVLPRAKMEVPGLMDETDHQETRASVVTKALLARLAIPEGKEMLGHMDTPETLYVHVTTYTCTYMYVICIYTVHVYLYTVKAGSQYDVGVSVVSQASWVSRVSYCEPLQRQRAS